VHGGIHQVTAGRELEVWKLEADLTAVDQALRPPAVQLRVGPEDVGAVLAVDRHPEDEVFLGPAHRVGDPNRRRLTARQEPHRPPGGVDKVDIVQSHRAVTPPPGVSARNLRARFFAGHVGAVARHHRGRRPDQHRLALPEVKAVVGELLDQAQVMAYQQDRGPAPLQPRDPVQAAVGKNFVPHRQDLIHHQHVRLHRDRHREPEPDVHARGVRLDGLVDELADAGELDDLR